MKFHGGVPHNESVGDY